MVLSTRTYLHRLQFFNEQKKMKRVFHRAGTRLHPSQPIGGGNRYGRSARIRQYSPERCQVRAAEDTGDIVGVDELLKSCNVSRCYLNNIYGRLRAVRGGRRPSALFSP